MPTLRLDISDSLAESFDTERELLGFESREAYLRWIVEHRTDIDVGSDRDQILTAYSERVAELEARLEDGDGSVLGGAPESERPGAAVDGADGGEANANAESVREPRTARIEDDSVNELATELAGVADERLDAFARAAVRRTGESFDGSPESGLEYDLPIEFAEGDRPGEAITDLDAVDVPGHDQRLIDRRRIAVGAALVFLREHEELRRSDFVTALYEEYPAGYEASDTWWECIKRGLRQIDRVRPAREGRRVWGFDSTPGRVTRLPSRK